MLKSAKTLLTIGLVFTIIGLVTCLIMTISGTAASALIVDMIKDSAAESGETIPEEVLDSIPLFISTFCIILDICFIPGIVFTILAKKKAANAKAKNEVIAMAILAIIFSGSVFTIIGAILMLSAPARMYQLQR